MLHLAHLRVFESSDLQNLTLPRDGEVKLGQALEGIRDVQDLASLRVALENKAKSGVRYGIIGIPEDIGPRANFGRGGSHEAWDPFVTNLANIQSNKFLNADKIAVIGSIDVSELQQQAINLDSSKVQDINKLRILCSQLDQIVEEVVQTIFASGLELIVIGGGHNNTYPIQKGLANSQAEAGKPIGVACINCDPHADFRAIEGRHSGNGFTYAHREEILKAYYVVGLHESYNSETLLDSFKQAGFQYSTYEDIKIRAKLSWGEAIQSGVEYLKANSKMFAVGIELDLDSIVFSPVSAETPNGLTCEETAHFVYRVASECSEVAYLHIPEGAPKHYANLQAGKRYVGRTITNAVTAYIKAREERRIEL